MTAEVKKTQSSRTHDLSCATLTLSTKAGKEDRKMTFGRHFYPSKDFFSISALLLLFLYFSLSSNLFRSGFGLFSLLQYLQKRNKTHKDCPLRLAVNPSGFDSTPPLLVGTFFIFFCWFCSNCGETLLCNLLLFSEADKFFGFCFFNLLRVVV